MKYTDEVIDAGMAALDANVTRYEMEDGAITVTAIYEAMNAATWQPIETAPKTSKAIEVWVSQNLCHFIVSWRSEESRWEIFGGGYRSFLSGGDPTHWRPLSAPPSIDRE